MKPIERQATNVKTNFYQRLRKKTLLSLAALTASGVVATSLLASRGKLLLGGCVGAAALALILLTVNYSHWNLLLRLRRMGLSEGEIARYKAGELTLEALQEKVRE